MDGNNAFLNAAKAAVTTEDRTAVYYVPMGFGFGTVSFYDPNDGQWVNLPAMNMMGDPIMFGPTSLDPLWEEAQQRIQQTGIPVGPGAPRSPVY